MLKLSKINAGYGPKQVLRDVSLEVKTGEVVALLGSNGAGKSTVLKVVAGLLSPTSGTVSFCGKEIASYPAYRIARMGIGYVMQNGPLFGSLTVLEHQILATSGGHKANDLKKMEHEDAPFLKIYSKKRGGVLSGGERQRLAVELCLRRNPKLLLLDEPSAGVSPGIALDIYAWIRERIKGTETAVLVVEQNIHFLPGFASRFVVLRNGEIFQENLPMEILEDDEKMFKVFFGEENAVE